MLKWIGILVAGLVIVTGAALWWLTIGFSHAPKSADGMFDIATWRSLAGSMDGPLPVRIEVQEVGHDKAPLLAARAGAFGQEWQTSYNAVRVVYPDGAILIGGAVDRAMAESMVQDKNEWSFDDAAYEQLIKAISTASQVLMTHEHRDHIIAIARYPDAEALAPHLWANAAQIAALPRYVSPLPEAFRTLQPRLSGEVEAVAPGIVAVPAPGHTPGSQLVFIKLQSGEEYLLIGDIVWSMSSIEELTMRPVLTQYVVFDPNEDRAAIKDQIRAIHDLMADEPGLIVFPSHDRIWLEKLAAEGKIGWGFTN